ncbi:MAG: transcriptional repressor [Turicibacter sp.]|nr:transcriptional repressor [Turicibacter sp.]
MTQLSKYETMIMKSGSKLTNQRKQILKIIVNNSDEHFSAETLYDLVRQVDSSVGIATVYRTLELFEKLKIVRNVKIKNDGVNYYDVIDLDEQNHFHHHLICTVCNQIIEIADELENYEAFINEKYGFKVTDHDLTLYGVCQSCQLLKED